MQCITHTLVHWSIAPFGIYGAKATTMIMLAYSYVFLISFPFLCCIPPQHTPPVECTQKHQDSISGMPSKVDAKGFCSSFSGIPIRS